MGPFLAFDSAWFQRHQAGLLFLLNAPGLRWWFRWVLRIHRDVPAGARINLITPTSFIYGAGLRDNRIEATLNARTHAKFAKRIYEAFKPLWWTLHFWDWLIADRFIPQWSFGFLTLTVFPAAGANSPVDGYVSRSNTDQTFSTIRSSAGTDADVSGTDLLVYLLASSTSNQFSRINRVIACFDTSALGAGASISSAVLSLYLNLKLDGGIGQHAIHICASTPASTATLATSDYGNLGTTSFANIAYASLTGGAYNDFTLNSNGIANVSLTGVSQFGARGDYDLTGTFGGTWGSGAYQYTAFNSADNSGTSSDPQLVITYTTGSAESFPAGHAGRNVNSLLRM